MTDTPRVWEMYGHAASNGVWVAVGEQRWVQLHGYGPPPVPVTVTEDPEGDYMGWIAANDKAEEPVMIQHHRIFNIQFPYGYKPEEEHGRGKAVRLTITVRDAAPQA